MQGAQNIEKILLLL